MSYPYHEVEICEAIGDLYEPICILEDAVDKATKSIEGLTMCHTNKILLYEKCQARIPDLLRIIEKMKKLSRHS